MLNDIQIIQILNKLKVISAGKCTEWTGGKSSGYGMQWDPQRKSPVFAHRAAWAQVHGKIPKGKIIRHLCHNPSCVNVKHLAIGTNQDNSNDMKAAGRSARGELNGAAKLTDLQAREIYALKGQISGYKVAKEYNISPSPIYKIWNKQKWKHIHNV